MRLYLFNRPRRLSAVLFGVWAFSLLLFHFITAAQAQEIEIQRLRDSTKVMEDNNLRLGQLLGELTLLKWAVGATVTALVSAVGFLFRAVMEANAKQLEQSKTEVTAREIAAGKMTEALVNATVQLARMAEVQASVAERLEEVSEKLAKIVTDSGLIKLPSQSDLQLMADPQPPPPVVTRTPPHGPRKRPGSGEERTP